MICEHCGTDYVVVGQHDGDRVSPWHTHTAEKCRDILKAKLIRDLIEECYQRGLAASEARVRELEADVERLRDAVQLEISQRRVDDSYGRDKSACQTVSDILERRGNDFGLMSALAADLLNSLAAAEAQAEHNLAIEHEANRHDPVRRKLDAAEAKLAMAVERIKRVDYLCEKQDHYPYIRIELAETLRALGIDPSKETP